MKIGIIDNETRYLEELIQFAKDNDANEVTVYKYNHIDLSKLQSCDFIILSGGHKFPVMLSPDKYSDEINFIKSSNQPILGICMGFEIIAFAYGSELERMPIRETGELELKILTPSVITDNLKSVKVHEHHRWHVKKLGSDLVSLAESEDGIEIIKHKNKAIYGFQFHPELDPSGFRSLFNDLK